MADGNADDRAHERASDRAAWVGETLESFERPLTLYAQRLLGDREQARDVVQETFLRLCRQERAELDGHLRRWLFTVCRNRALDELRRRKHVTPTNTEQAVNGRPSAAPPPDRVVEERDAATTAARAVEALPEREREVIHLKFQGGLSYREIAAVTGFSLSYVGVLIHTGMKRLRRDLAPQLGLERAKGANR